jgi:hypothetical protein
MESDSSEEDLEWYETPFMKKLGHHLGRKQPNGFVSGWSKNDLEAEALIDSEILITKLQINNNKRCINDNCKKKVSNKNYDVCNICYNKYVKNVSSKMLIEILNKIKILKNNRISNDLIQYLPKCSNCGYYLDLKFLTGKSDSKITILKEYEIDIKNTNVNVIDGEWLCNQKGGCGSLNKSEKIIQNYNNYKELKFKLEQINTENLKDSLKKYKNVSYELVNEYVKHNKNL